MPAITPRDYADLVIRVTRRNAKTVAVRVIASPAGSMRSAQVVAFSASEADRIHDTFVSRPTTGQSGRASITQAEAVGLGKRLARVLLPSRVFELLARSLMIALQGGRGGLRVRLVLHPSVMDLPWEYVYRPDRADRDGLSGFLLLDPAVSMVRGAVEPRMRLEPITGSQRMAFVGTFWEGHVDGWTVWGEFDQLRSALQPVSRYITPAFALASDLDVFDRRLEEGAAIFHYAGHCDVDARGRAYLVREMPIDGDLRRARKAYLDDVGPSVARAGGRLAVLSACNSGFWGAVQPLLESGIPAVIGVNGAVASDSTIAFCARLYESLAVGLTLDEAVGRARLHAMEWGQRSGLFDWGLYMVYLSSANAVLFPRTPTPAVTARQAEAQQAHLAAAGQALQRARELDGLNFGEIMSELTRRRVLLLGRFTGRRLRVLEAVKQHLSQHENRYIPELFTFARPDSRDLVEAIIGMAALSRFIVADLSEPRSLQSELEAIVPHFPSIPVVPIINQTGREYATFSSIRRRPNVVQPTVRYRDVEDLMRKLDALVVPVAEEKLREVQP